MVATSAASISPVHVLRILRRTNSARKFSLTRPEGERKVVYENSIFVGGITSMNAMSDAIAQITAKTGWSSMAGK